MESGFTSNRIVFRVVTKESETPLKGNARTSGDAIRACHCHRFASTSISHYFSQYLQSIPCCFTLGLESSSWISINHISLLAFFCLFAEAGQPDNNFLSLSKTRLPTWIRTHTHTHNDHFQTIIRLFSTLIAAPIKSNRRLAEWPMQSHPPAQPPQFILRRRSGHAESND